MNQEERKQKIDSILEEVKRHGRMTGNGIPIELWIDAQDGKPGDPAFEEWLKCCTEAVDDYEAMTGKKDRDSVFAEYIRKYGPEGTQKSSIMSKKLQTSFETNKPFTLRVLYSGYGAYEAVFSYQKITLFQPLSTVSRISETMLFASCRG